MKSKVTDYKFMSVSVQGKVCVLCSLQHNIESTDIEPLEDVH